MPFEPSRSYLAPERPEHTMTLLRACVGVLMIAAGTFLGVLGFSEYSRWQYPHEYMPAPDYAE